MFIEIPQFLKESNSSIITYTRFVLADVGNQFKVGPNIMVAGDALM